MLCLTWSVAPASDFRLIDNQYAALFEIPVPKPLSTPILRKQFLKRLAQNESIGIPIVNRKSPRLLFPYGEYSQFQRNIVDQILQLLHPALPKAFLMKRFDFLQILGKISQVAFRIFSTSTESCTL